MRARTRLVAIGGAALGCLFAKTTWGQAVPDCSDATMFPNPVFLTGSTAYQPTAGTFAVKLSTLTDPTQRMTIIYQNGLGSCDGPPAILNNTMLNGIGIVFTAGPAYATDPTSLTRTNCTLSQNRTADIGVSDIFWANCPNLATTPQPTTIKDFQGPVQAMIFVTPSANTSFTALSAAMGQLIWGCGPNGMVSPFTDVNGIMQRNSLSGSQGIVAKAIGVPAASFFGFPNAGGGNVVTSLASYAMMNDPTKAIGFIAGDLFDSGTNRTALNPIAFQAFNQTKAYYADSAKDTKDRKNLRDGHYVVWGPEHFYATVDANGVPTSPMAAKFLGSQNGTMFSTAFDYIQLQALAGVVPQCAMKVKRADDGGPLSPNTGITDPCGCFYEKTRTGTTSCVACPNGNSDCTGGKTCHHGYCE